MFPSCVASRRNGCPFLIFGLFSEQALSIRKASSSALRKLSSLPPSSRVSGSLPSGILAEQHPHCKGCTSAFLHFLPRRLTAFICGESANVLAAVKDWETCIPSSNSSIVQKNSIRLLKGVPCGKIRIVQSPTQDTVLIIIYAHQCHPAFVSPCPVLHPRNTSFPITRNPLTWSVYHSAVTKPVTFLRFSFRSHRNNIQNICDFFSKLYKSIL